MVKKRLISIIAIIVVVVSVLCFCGCVGNFKLISLEKAYEQGLISYEDVAQIAYHAGGNQGLFDDDFVPKDIGNLSKTTEKNIKNSLASYYETTAEHVDVKAYYGTYNGYAVIRYDVDNVYGTLAVEYTYIGDYVFIAADSTDGIYLYKKL